MEAHDYQGDGGPCLECQRPPGNYLHVGISDADLKAMDWPAHTVPRPLSEVVEPPLALINDGHRPIG